MMLEYGTFCRFSLFFRQSDGMSLARPNAFAKMADPVKTMTDIFLQMTPNSTKILNKWRIHSNPKG